MSAHLLILCVFQTGKGHEEFVCGDVMRMAYNVRCRLNENEKDSSEDTDYALPLFTDSEYDGPNDTQVLATKRRRCKSDNTRTAKRKRRNREPDSTSTSDTTESDSPSQRQHERQAKPQAMAKNPVTSQHPKHVNRRTPQHNDNTVVSNAVATEEDDELDAKLRRHWNKVIDPTIDQYVRNKIRVADVPKHLQQPTPPSSDTDESDCY